YVAARMLMAPRPSVALAEPFDVVGRNAPLVVNVKDEHGLAAARITVRQGGQEKVVLERTYDPPQAADLLRWEPAKDKSVRLQEGAGQVVVWVRNDSWGNFMRGRTVTLEKQFTARLTPPRVEVLTGQHYVNQGGCDVVVYKVTPREVDSGVQVGEVFFRGFALPGAADPSTHFAVFCLPYDAAPGTSMQVKARDEAANESRASFWTKVFPRRFRSRELPLEDGFLNKVVSEIMSQTTGLEDRGSLLENYLQINRDLRRANNEALARLTRSSRPAFLWSEPFRQLGSSQVEAQFADYRTYVYQGKPVDKQVHLGFDLATTSHAPVTAANDGLVVMAEFFGIYGNTVVIDHGYGLMSLYGHLSSFAVNKGDEVKRGQTVGNSGATGLASGDHLHFSMLYQDVQVDPREWWDPHWIHDRLAAKLAQFGNAAGPGKMAQAAASPTPAAAPGAASPSAPR
ncbi:MAG TPA: M23 family metallopeptidase, partial [Vicinamibacteria bacterium]|nr:M23 family metallopeptidase [Vicinamibacteria bacterium]